MARRDVQRSAGFLYFRGLICMVVFALATAAGVAAGLVLLLRNEKSAHVAGGIVIGTSLATGVVMIAFSQLLLTMSRYVSRRT